ncbi:MAG: hypothetical protein HY327_13230 [Chloroflexi bacterium]|nr:hypothetical protein [Chloroflexota bacterium]
MSAENLSQIIARAVADAQYRELLFSQTDSAFEGYELTDGEKTLLKNLSRENFDSARSELGARISRGGLTMGSLDTLLSPTRRS